MRGRIALMSGGSRGIGRALVECFAEAGAHVSFSYLRNERAAEEAAAAAASHGVGVMAHRADVSLPKEAERLVSDTLERFGRIDFLVCNAGVWEGAPVEEIGEELWDRVIDINLKGTWALCRAAVPALKRQRFGRIVVVSSTAGQRGEANVSNYAASKGGQISFAKSLAVELAPFGVTVNAVAPGWVETEMNASVFSDPEFRASVERTIPLGRIPAPEDVAYPILFLCSDWARHITGEVLNVNGGSVLCG